MTTVQSADGVKHEFPDNTPQDAIHRAMKTYAKEMAPADPSVPERFFRGVTDLGEGAAQLLTKVGAVSPIAAAKDSEGVKKEAKIPHVSEVEGFDLVRAVGEATNPLPYGGAWALGKAGFGPMVRSIGAGGLASVLEPVADENKLGEQKAKQAAEGMALGFGFRLGGKVASKGVEAFGSYLAEHLPESVAQYVPEGFSKSEATYGSRAVHTILKRIEEGSKAGGPTAQQALELIQAAKAVGKPMTLADIPGPPQRLAGSVYRSGGEAGGIAKNFLTSRDQSAAARLRGDISKYVSSGDTAFKTTEALLQARSAAARPAYANLDNLEGIWSPRLQQFIEDPTMQQAMAKGYAIERMASLAENRPFNPTMMGVDLDAEGNIKLLQAPNMRVLDMGKQGLDSMIAEQRDPLTGRLSNIGVALDKVRRAYVQTIDELDTKGVYKAARQAWSGYSGSLDALKLGKSVFDMSPEEGAAAVGKLSDGDKQFYRIGVADKMMEKLARTGLSGDETKSILKNQWMRDQLRPAFGSQKEYDDFMGSVAKEADMFRTNVDVMGNSKTAERVTDDQGFKDAAAGMGIVARLGSGDAMGVVRGAVDLWKLHRDLGLRPDPRMNVAIAKIMFDPNAPEAAIAKSLLADPAAKVVPKRAISPYVAGATGEFERDKQ